MNIDQLLIVVYFGGKGGKMISTKKRREMILSVLKDLGGVATTRQIAEKVGLNVNGVSQTLGILQQVECLSGKGGECKWKLRNF